MSLTLRPPVTKPLLRAGTPKPVPPDSRAYDTFRVTQQFGTLDSYWADIDRKAGRAPRTHGAVDIGNFRCGDALLAMGDGVGRRVHDNAKALGAPSDALGFVIDHAFGITSEVWHLNGYMVGDGLVQTGQQIGVVGNTGLRAQCHVHIELKRNGIRIDPEPHLFGVPIPMEDDMRLPAGLSSLTYATLGAGNRIRVDPETTDGSTVTTQPERVQVFGEVTRPKASWTIGKESGDTWYFIGLGFDSGYVATPLLPSLQVTPLGTERLPAADCSAQERTIAQLNTKIARASTSAQGAAQAAVATAEALR